MQFTIRQATIKDFKEIQRLNQALFNEEHSTGHDNDLDLDWPQNKHGQAYFKKALTHRDYLVLIAEDENNIPLGYIFGCSKNKFNWRKSKMGELDNLYVIPRARRLGVARSLVKQLDDWFRSKKIYRVYVATYFLNTEAHKFYQTVGFTPLDLSLEKKLDA